MGIKIHEQRHGAVSVLKPAGPLTQADAAEFKALALRTIDACLGRFVVDLSATPYVDSNALEALLELTEQLSASGQVLKLCAVNKTVREVFHLTGTASMFEHYDDVNTGVRSFL